MILVVIAIVLISSAVWFFFLQGAGVGKYRETLIIAIPEEIEGTDIQQVSWANEFHALLYQPLVVFDEKMNLVPDLAIEFEVVNGKDIIFRLPKDAKFSNGDPLTAEIIKESIERYKRISPYAEDFAVIEKVEIIDEYTVKIVNKEPPAYLWAVLTTVYGAPVNTKVAEEIGDEAFNRESVGSGPYMLKEWVRGSHIKMVVNPNYITNMPFVKNKGPNQYVKEVIIRFIPEDLTRISEFLAGRVDIIRGVPAEEVKRLRENPDVVLYESISPGINYIMVNMQHEILSDPNVRKAIMIAINRDELAEALDNTVMPWYSLFSPTMICYNESVEKYAESIYSYNLEKAKQLLAEAGWVDTDGDGIVDKDGKPLKLTLLSPVDRPSLKKVAPLIQAQLRAIGIDIEIQEFTYSIVREKTRNWDFELALRLFSWADPDIYIYLAHSQVANYTYQNPLVDQIIEKARTIMDLTERTKAYSKMQLIMLEDLFMIPIFVEKDYIATRKNVEGLIVLPPYGTMVLNDVKVLEEGGGTASTISGLLLTVSGITLVTTSVYVRRK